MNLSFFLPYKPLLYQPYYDFGTENQSQTSNLDFYRFVNRTITMADFGLANR